MCVDMWKWVYRSLDSIVYIKGSHSVEPRLRQVPTTGSPPQVPHHRFPITRRVVLASHPLPEEHQGACNSVNALRMNKRLAIEKDAEIEVVTPG